MREVFEVYFLVFKLVVGEGIVFIEEEYEVV